MGRMLLLCLALLLTAMPVAAADGLRVTEIVITSKVVKGKPIDSIKRLSSATEKRLYCFTRTEGGGEGSVIKHVWYHGEEKIGEFELPIKGERWRTYSKKLIQKGEAGPWRVDVLDRSGTLLKSIAFTMN